MKIKYTEGYKYQLAEDYVVMTPIVGVEVVDFYFTLERSGRLTGKKGYAWDGASGPTFDTKNSMSPSLDYVHFDGCVNHGIKQASKFLQRALGVEDDGAIGPKTLSAVRQDDAAGRIEEVCNNILDQ